MEIRHVDKRELITAVGKLDLPTAYNQFYELTKEDHVYQYITSSRAFRDEIHAYLRIPDAEIEAAWKATRTVEEEKRESNRSPRESLEIRLLKEHLPLLLANRERILHTPEYFFCTLEDAYASLAYVGGGRLYLGVLALVWKRELVRSACIDCGGPLFLLGLAGSPLSGTHSIWGICSSCRDHKTWMEPSLTTIAMPIRELIQKYPNEAIVKKGQRRTFSWAGLVGEDTPDEVIRPAVEGKNLLQVVWELSDDVQKQQCRDKYGDWPELRALPETDELKYGFMEVKGKKFRIGEDGLQVL